MMPTIKIILSGFENPRGVATVPAGDLFRTGLSGLAINRATLLIDLASFPLELACKATSYETS